MPEIGEELLSSLRASLPGAKVYWERDPAVSGLDGAAVTAEYQNRKFTVQFERAAGGAPDEELDASFVEQVVDDFIDFFARTIYPKEKFTRII